MASSAVWIPDRRYVSANGRQLGCLTSGSERRRRKFGLWEGMMDRTRRLFLLAGMAMGVTACGASSSPSQTSSPSVSVQASTVASASPTRAPSPTPSPAVAVACDKAPMAFNASRVDLTGAWAGDDGGIYYLRQVGSIVWWNGMSGRDGRPSDLGRDWNNVGRGEIDGLTVQVEWADVPRGGILGDGTLTLTIEDDGTGNVRIAKASETGTGFGNSLWTPCKPG